MSRRIAGEYVMTGTLTATTALSIGNGQPGVTTDSACLRDGAGCLIIPGSALAGALRQSSSDKEPWGNGEFASVVYIEDAHAPASAVTEVRDAVGIDRETGSAASDVLYSRDVAAPGTTFRCEVRVEAMLETSEDSGDAQRMAGELIVAIQDRLRGGLSLGGSTTSGLGRIELTEPVLTWREFGSRSGILRLLSGGVDAVDVDDTVQAQRTHRLRITVPWRPRSPLLVSVSANGLVDRLPLTTGAGDDVRLALPGSSVKGALRSRAEQIVRTMTGRTTVPEDFLDQMAEDLGPVGRLFGRPPKKRRAGGRDKGWRGAATIGEVYSGRIAAWQDVVEALSTRAPRGDDKVANAKPRIDAIQALKKSPIRINDHVAISRWTGGAADDRLFAVAAPEPQFTWDALTIDVDLQRLGADASERASALMLLVYLLRDFTEGWIGLGYGTTRGYGEVSAEPGDITFAFPSEPLLPESCGVADRTLALSELLVSPAGSTLLDAWNAEIPEPTETGVPA